MKIISLLILISVLVAQKKSPIDYVDPFIGTEKDGHLFPGSVAPFGFVQLSPDTDEGILNPIDKKTGRGILDNRFTKWSYDHDSYPWCAGYQYSDNSIIGFSHTHFSGTGYSDLGDVLIMPTTGELKFNPGTKKDPDIGYRSRFSHDRETAKPGYYAVQLDDYNIKAELTTSERVGMHRYTFPESEQSQIILDLVHNIFRSKGRIIWSQIRVENDRFITGYRETKGWWTENIRRIFFAIEFSKPFDSHEFNKSAGNGINGSRSTLRDGAKEIQGNNIKAAFKFKTEEGEVLQLKVGLSAVDVDGAIRNLNKEIPHWNFDRIVHDTQEKWRRELDHITVEASEDEKTFFYTSLYRTSIAPHLYMDVDGRYRGLDGRIHVAEEFKNYSLWSLWDTYRALHPLLTLTQPEKVVGDMMTSMIKHSEQKDDGILPVWAFQGLETYCMIGYHAVPVLADAYLKGNREFDANKAFKAMVHSANFDNYDHLGFYKKNGYVPVKETEKGIFGEGTSQTLEYAYDDWTIYAMARAMGNSSQEKTFEQRALNYKNVYDSETHFMRPKLKDGSFVKKFDPKIMFNGFTEGNAWQYSWYVPHDVSGLISLMGGDEKFTKKLDELFVTELSEEDMNSAEDVTGIIGAYSAGNEPGHHTAYMYNFSGYPWKTQERIHQITSDLFSIKPDGLCGNDDAGQMSAWYVFTSLGFYPVAPGTNEYVIGSPHLKHAKMNLPNGNVFTMTANNYSKKNIYIQSAKLNGKAHNKGFIKHEDIVNGGTLVFEMGNKPNKSWASAKENRPYSLSDTID